MAKLVIRNGLVVDGTGGEPFEADVAIEDGYIVEIGPKLAVKGAQEIDAKVGRAPSVLDPCVCLPLA
jgi:N-acyl-D-aspartate/D-glutamate deacylase